MGSHKLFYLDYGRAANLAAIRSEQQRPGGRMALDAGAAFWYTTAPMAGNATRVACQLIVLCPQDTQTVDHLWSPWRMEYITGPKTDVCVFCAKLTPGDEAVEHVLLRGRTAFVTLNRYPYNNGHLLVVPYAHVPGLEDLPAETLAEMMLLVNQGLAALRLAMKPDGFNIGVNLGKAAGAGIESHVHIHVVPRWYGDTSFMAAIGETRTIPETLDQTYQRVRAALQGA